MKSLSLLITLSAMLTGGASLAASDPEKTVAAFHDAIQRGDKEAVLAQLDENVLIFESGHVERSRAEYASHHLPADITFSKAVSRKVLRSTAQISGNMAVITQETETSGRYEDKPVHLIGVETTLLLATNDNWRIKHVHWSSRKAH